MNKFYLTSLLGLFILSIGACSKYDPIFGVANNNTVEEIKLTKDIAYIYDNDIYLANEILEQQKKLTNSPTSTKTHIALSPKHNRIAYLNANKTPVIIDTSGNVKATLSQYINVSDITWHPNNGDPTLVILVNNSIEFYGSNLNIPTDPFSYVFPSDVTFTAIDAIDIADNLDILFTYRYQRPYSLTSPLRKYYHGVAVNFANSGFDKNHFIEDGYYSPTSSSYSAQNYPYYHNIKHNEADENASVGYITNGRENSYTYYRLYSYIYGGSSNGITTLSTSLSSENNYQEYNEGDVVANPFQIRKYLKVLPPNIPPPTGTANTFTLNFQTINDSHPTYFDWNP